MKIMVDATSLARTITGIENYTKNLVCHLINIVGEGDELIILFRKEIPPYIKNQKTVKLLVSPFKSQLLTEQIWIPFVKHSHKPDVIHFPAFPPPLLIRKNIIFTIHDATMWKHEDTLSLKNKLYMRPLSSRGIRLAEKLFTVSDFSKKEIIDVFPIASKKIFNTGISISNDFQVITDDNVLSQVKKKYNLPEKYFLSVGSLEPRKNLLFLIKAFIKLKNKINTDYKLVITGRSAWGSNEIRDLILENNVEKDIILTGYIKDQDLISLYNLATYFVFPSIYEGFGLPVLEAMACGTPVIISNVSSLPEVACESAIYIDPYDETSLISALEKVISDEKIHADLREKGLKRSKNFSWEGVSKRIYKEYLN